MTDDDEAQQKPRKGRPAGKRGTFTFRVTADLRSRLEAAAAASERPVSEEIERRLERSFEDIDLLLSYFGSSQTLKLAQSVSLLSNYVETDTGKRWTEDADTRQHFADAVEHFMDVFFYQQGTPRKYLNGLEGLFSDRRNWVGRNAAESVARFYGLRSHQQEEIEKFLATPEGAAALAKFQAEDRAEQAPAQAVEPQPPAQALPEHNASKPRKNAKR